MSKTLRSLCLALISLSFVQAGHAEQIDSTVSSALDQRLPEYSPAKIDSGALTSVGSDSMGGLVDVWVKEYGQLQSGVNIRVANASSATASAALIEGSADLGPMVRPMKSPELKDFQKKYGFQPTQVRTAAAAVAVYVSANNPLNEISFEQLDAIFSSERRRSFSAEKGSGKTAVSKWSALGVTGALANQEILPIGQVRSSYLNTFFRQRVLLQAPFSRDVFSVAGELPLFDALTKSDNAIAYGAYTDKLPANVKMIAVKRDAEEKAVLPTMSRVLAGTYPLSRYLNVYIARTPGKGVEVALKDFLRFVLSKQGQAVVVKEGLIPLPAKVAKQELKKIL